jgi:neutral ceramidase
MLAYFEKVEKKPDDEKPYHSKEKIYAARIRNLTDEPNRIRFDVQCFQIGGLAIATIPFEVFAEIGLEIKEQSPFDQTFTISLANGSFGYLPTPEHHELGGYETWLGTNVVEKQASRIITDAVLQQLQENYPEPSAN